MAIATALKVIDGRLTERDSRESDAAERENCISHPRLLAIVEQQG